MISTIFMSCRMRNSLIASVYLLASTPQTRAAGSVNPTSFQTWGAPLVTSSGDVFHSDIEYRNKIGWISYAGNLLIRSKTGQIVRTIPKNFAFSFQDIQGYSNSHQPAFTELVNGNIAVWTKAGYSWNFDHYNHTPQDVQTITRIEVLAQNGDFIGRFDPASYAVGKYGSLQPLSHGGFLVMDFRGTGIRFFDAAGNQLAARPARFSKSLSALPVNRRGFIAVFEFEGRKINIYDQQGSLAASLDVSQFQFDSNNLPEIQVTADGEKFKTSWNLGNLVFDEQGRDHVREGQSFDGERSVVRFFDGSFAAATGSLITIYQRFRASIVKS